MKQAKKKAIDENKSFSARVEKLLNEYLDRQEAVEAWNRRADDGKD